ncbi:hypothetical protein WBG78_09890 [Chryseolinea sp. T2]|uniref:hypothetical protein n=1 Tax=Chryseolinea sp. T2 TaxID=3129255 RepID=UPI0030776863
MGQKNVSLEILDRLVHYSLALTFGLPILCFVGYPLLGQFELFGISSSIDIWVVVLPGIILAPISLLFYFIQHEKLRFQFLRTATDVEDSKKMIRDIAREQKWAIRSFKDNVFTIKTNPGFINQSWGQHITIQIVNGGLLVNSIFDPNKGSWSITFNSNQKNIEQIRKLISDRAN